MIFKYLYLFLNGSIIKLQKTNMKITSLFLIMFLLVSCGNEKKLHLVTDNLSVLNSCIISNDFTIVCYVDSANCTTCSMQWLQYWASHEDELKELNTGIALVVRNPDEEAVRDALDQLLLHFPVTFDMSSTFKQNNKLLLTQQSVFAVNKEKEVVWLGLPIESDKTWQQFCKTIKHLSKSN